MKGRVTMADIAEKLGLSKGVVSRALRDQYGVNPNTKNRIVSTALEMGYNFKSLHSRRDTAPVPMDRICVIINRSDYLNDPFYGEILAGVENALSERRYEFYLSVLENISVEQLADTLAHTKARGIIMIGLFLFSNIAETMSHELPVVLVDACLIHLYVDRVFCNNFMAGYEATRHLIDAGHRRLAFIGDVAFSGVMEERYRGYRHTLATYPAPGANEYEDLSVLDRHGDEWPPALMTNEAALARMLETAPKPIGLVCANDGVALEVYRAAAKLGLNIPQDVSVVGIDNVGQDRLLQPPLTSIDVRKFELGRQAVYLLLDRLQHPEMPTQYRQMDGEIVRRESVRFLEPDEKKKTP